MDEANTKSDMSKTYKLFNWITLQNQDQLLRYFSPTLYREKAFVEPMWASQINRYPQGKLPPCCEHCNQPRTFELQIMPCVFDIIDELRLVDWQTIAIYTCSNPDCTPDFSKDEYYHEEFSYIQFSEDFKNVKYGDEKQI